MVCDSLIDLKSDLKLAKRDRQHEVSSLDFPAPRWHR